MADLDRFTIRVFVSDDGGKPAAVAMVWDRGRMLPAVEFGETATDAQNKLAAFLASEIARERRLIEVAAERSERMKARAPKKGAA